LQKVIKFLQLCNLFQSYINTLNIRRVCATGDDKLECNWADFSDAESEVDYYKFGIGRALGDDSVFVFQRIDPNVNEYKASGKH